MNQASPTSPIHQSWHSVFVRATNADPVTEALRAALTARGYAPYDPFPGGTGTPPRLSTMVRHFVAPPVDGWVRVLGEPDPAALHDAQVRIARPLLWGWVTETGGGFAVLADGARDTAPDAFVDFLRPGQSVRALRQAFAGERDVGTIETDDPPVAVLNSDSLPPELQEFAQQQGVDADKAQSLVERLGGKLLGRFTGDADSDETQQAYQMLTGTGGDLWNGPHGRRVRAIASVVDLPPNWRVPSVQEVRDAYQLFRLRQRSPRMMAMPGDDEAMAAVPNALAYTPVYMGKQGSETA